MIKRMLNRFGLINNSQTQPILVTTMSNTLPLNQVSNVGTTPGPIGITGSWNTGGIIIKQTCYVLTSNQNAFDSFLALGVDAREAANTNFVFVKDVDDIKNGGSIRILNDFFMHPKVDDILEFLGKKLYFSGATIGPGVVYSGVYITGNVGMGGATCTSPQSKLQVSPNSSNASLYSNKSTP